MIPDTNDTNQPPVNQIEDKRQKPPGVLPRNAQAWVVIGLALLMIGVISLSGKNPPKVRPDSPPPPPLDPSASRIQEYQRRIEEQARKLQLEQAELARTRQALESTPGAPAGTPSVGSQSRSPYQEPEARNTAMGPRSEQDPMEADRKKREYQSLSASNIALSYRKETVAQENPPSESATAWAKALALYGFPNHVTAGPPASSSSQALLRGDSIPVTAQQEKAETDSRARESNERNDGKTGKSKQENYDEFNRAEGKRYRVFEGMFFETVLTNRLDGYYAGPINCMVTTNIYSHDGQSLLVPQGSRILGEVRRVDSFGQQRLAVFFHRLIMPDGYSVSLDKFQGLNQIGETGLRDQINHHYLQVFGASLAIGAIAGLSQANTRYGLDESAADAYRQGVASSLSQSALRILDRYLNVLPTFTIREGHRVKIYLSNDLLLPAYEKHQMPSDL